MSASTCSPPRPALMRIGPPSAPSRASFAKSGIDRMPRVSGVSGRSADEDVGAREKRDRARPRHGTSRRRERRRPAGSSRRPESRDATSTSAASRPRTPSPMIPTRTSAAAGCGELLPAALALLRGRRRAAGDGAASTCSDDPLGHALGQVGADDPHDRHVGEAGLEDEMVDAGAEREDRREVRAAREQIPPAASRRAHSRPRPGRAGRAR